MKTSRVAAAVIGLALLPAQAVDLSNLQSLVTSTADGGWVKVNLNGFQNAYPALADRTSTGYDNPSAVIKAWSSFAWDTERGQLMLFGGGHANYAGNEMYLWSGVSQQWSRGSLPSQVTAVASANGTVYLPVDGAMNAPSSMHTYDNSLYLSVADRFITLGGPVFNASSGAQAQQPDGSLRATGPYLWDPARADANKVGGTTGSAVNPAVVGGQMWQNRDVNANLFKITTFAGTFPLALTDGTTATAVEAGRDVVYFTGRGGPSQYLMKYTIVDLAQPSLDTISIVGSTVSGPGAYGSAGFDPVHGHYVALAETGGFVAYDTQATNGASNDSRAISYTISGAGSFDGNLIAGVDYDPTRGGFLVWTGAGDVWELETPASGNVADVWALSLVTDGDTFAGGTIPDGMDSAGVRGKWKYIANLDAFMALEGNVSGDVWLYRPEGWTAPIPEPSTALLMLLGAVALATRRRLRAEPRH